jgi:hypothetical protein
MMIPSTSATAHFPVYYRIYTKQGALESNNPIYSNDRFISRIVSRSVAPPHTAACLKKHIFRIEKFELSTKCTLYSSLSDQAPVEDSARLALRGISGPGVSEVDPVVLVVDVSDAEKRSKVTLVEAKDLIEWSSTRRYGASLATKDYTFPPFHVLISLLPCIRRGR